MRRATGHPVMDTLGSTTLAVTPIQVRPIVSEQYELWRACFAAQPAPAQRFLETQARVLADALVEGASLVRFALPDAIAVQPAVPDSSLSLRVPRDMRVQHVGSLIQRLTHANLGPAIRLRLQELEQSPDEAVAAAAGLVRYAAARTMVYQMLPGGRPVAYRASDEDEIPSIPTEDGLRSALTASSDAIAEEGDLSTERGQLQSPYVPAARRFFLPQWVICDEMDRLLVNSLEEAETRIAAMQRFLAVLHAAMALAPYFVADPEYQRKRYGMLGQLVNQGRALASYETSELVRIVRERAWAHDLNRGLRLSVPYFHDQHLEMRMWDFTVIPAGRIMFVPALVVRAARREQGKVAQDTRLNGSTRHHLLNQLRVIERAFARVPQGWRAPNVKTR